MNEFFYFQSPIYREDHPEWAEYALKKCNQYFSWTKENTPPEQVQAFPVVQTGHLAHDPDLQFLADFFKSSCVDILRRQGYDVDKYDFDVGGMWGQDIQCRGGHHSHIHKHSVMTGFFFMDTPENGAYPIFDDPRAGKLMVDLDIIQDGNVYVATDMVHFNNVAPGTFLFAPSWLPHRINTNVSENPTKFIHFILTHREKNQCNII